MTDDESVAFVCALMDGLNYGPISDEDGYSRLHGWRRGTQSVDREVRMLLACGVLVEHYNVVNGLPSGKPLLRRGPRQVKED